MPEYQNIELKQGETFSMNLNFATEVAAGTYSVGTIDGALTFDNATVTSVGTWDATNYGTYGPYTNQEQHADTTGSGTGIKCTIVVAGANITATITSPGNNYAADDVIVFKDPKVGSNAKASFTVATLVNEYAAAVRSTHSSAETDKFVLTWISANEIKMALSDEKTRDLSDTFTGYWDLLHKDYPASGDYSRILQGEVFVYPQITLRTDIA